MGLPIKIIQSLSVKREGYLNVLVEASSLEECLTAISKLVSQYPDTHFSDPQKVSDDTYVSFGQCRY